MKKVIWIFPGIEGRLLSTVFLLGNLISWKSKKNVVARSSAEIEYHAMAQTTCEIIWLKRLLEKLKFCKKKKGSMKLICDNQAPLLPFSIS